MKAKIPFSVSNDGVSIIHSATYRGCKVVVINFQNSRTIWREIFRPDGQSWASKDLDKYEWTVGSAKVGALDLVDEMLANFEKQRKELAEYQERNRGATLCEVFTAEKQTRFPSESGSTILPIAALIALSLSLTGFLFCFLIHCAPLMTGSQESKTILQRYADERALYLEQGADQDDLGELASRYAAELANAK